MKRFKLHELRSLIERTNKRHADKRKGGFLVIAFFALTVAVGFLALGVDLGVVSLVKTQQQNAADAAALAAAQEITAAIEQAGQEGDVGDVNSIAEDAARLMAEKVAELNGMYIDKDTDVVFGRRQYDSDTGDFVILWNEAPFNVVKVIVRKDNPTPNQPDSKLDLFFAPFFGDESVSLVSEAISFVEARDIVVVLDYSGSMSYDSEFPAMSSSKLGKAAVEDNLDNIWDTLVASGVEFSNRSKVKFPSTGFGEIDSYAGTYKSSSDAESVYYQLDLDETDSSGQLKYPFPQEGKNSSWQLYGQATGYSHKSKWMDYINWVKSDSHVNSYGYKKKYGYRTLVGYLIERRKKNRQSEDLWRAPVYPFHAMKEGMTLFTQFLDGLDFGDHIGLVTYDSSSRVESVLDDDGVDETADLGDEPITDDHAAIDLIQRHKQASHYDPYTGLGYGISDGIDLLSEHGRYGARPTLLVMTDGNANRSPSGWSLPGDWDWAELTDTDGDGSADYTTNDRHKQYAFYQAKRAIDAGYTIHTLTVGQGADRDLMEAIAFAGSGIWIDVPGGTSVAQMEAEMMEAFSRIAANVPPAKLLYSAD